MQHGCSTWHTSLQLLRNFFLLFILPFFFKLSTCFYSISTPLSFCAMRLLFPSPFFVVLHHCFNQPGQSYCHFTTYSFSHSEASVLSLARGVSVYGVYVSHMTSLRLLLFGCLINVFCTWRQQTHSTASMFSSTTLGLRSGSYTWLLPRRLEFASHLTPSHQFLKPNQYVFLPNRNQNCQNRRTLTRDATRRAQHVSHSSHGAKRKAVNNTHKNGRVGRHFSRREKRLFL